MFGFLNIYKPKGITSSKVIDILRRVTKIRQIGHSGTLDPVAEGVLPVAIGKATRLIDYLGNEKEYIAQMQFGKSSPTYDSEGCVTDIPDKKPISRSEVEAVLPDFTGNIRQMPPIYSAVHYNGKRLYELARKNISPDEIEIPEREIYIEELELLSFNFEEQVCELRIKCSKGTYIRSLVHDIALKLKSCAIMTKLLRTNSGGFRIENSLPLDGITLEIIRDNLIECNDIFDFKTLEISEEEFVRVRNGNSILCLGDTLRENEKVLVSFEKRTVALGERVGDRIVMNKVLNS